jgi:adenosylcobinamide kinase/adenosylcobinamide-phosphate guanylyltransferase
MRIRLLGTGSADGWPNPFCECPSCEFERREGRTRMPTSALVDDVVMIDSGPTAPYNASRGGISLRQVQHLVLTHGHPDHLAP